MGKFHNPLECCYKPQFSTDEWKDIINVFVRYHEELRNAKYDMNTLALYLVKSLSLRYKRVRLYVCNPISKIYYGYLSSGMDEEFREKFDSFPAHPFEKQKYQIEFDKVPTILSEKVTGTEETYLMCNKKIHSNFKTEKNFPDYIKDLGFGTLINHSLTVHIMAAQSIPVGAISLDFGNVNDKFSYEECQVLDALVGTYFGGLFSLFLVEDFKKEVSTRSTSTTSVFGASLTGESFYKKYKLSKKYGSIVYNGAVKPHHLDDVFKMIDKLNTAKQFQVFLNADTGTGKELVAKALHYHGVRKNGPFISLSCGELTDTLLQGELFGYAKGHGVAEGPKGEQKGPIEEADGGTLFLDEIGKASPKVRSSLLRLLSNKEVTRIGSTKVITVDFSLISSANENLETSHEFYNRLGVKISLPPLRERTYDIPILISYFIEKFHKKNRSLISELPISIDSVTSIL